MGDNADDILLSCKIASDQLENYNKVIECFESHFIPRRNIIYERARFNQRCQQEGEKVNEFITALHSLAEHCNFGMLHDELIRDRIVVGVRDRALSERMQLDTDLTLVKATLMAKQLESVKEQQSSLYQQDSVDQIKKMPNHIKEAKRHEPKIRQFKSNQLGGSSHGCTRCGNSNNHDWKNCPAMNSYCNKCMKKGHYAKVCRSEAINEIKSEIAFLGSVEDNSMKWIVPIKVNNRQVNFKIDTGADVNVLPLQYYYQSFQRIKLEKSDKVLQGPNGIPLETMGMIHVKLQNRGQHLNSKIYIVDKLKQPLLSGETSEKLNIVRMIQQLSSNFLNPKREFPKIFNGLGHAEINYKISLQPDAKPYALCTPRRVPIPLMKQVKEQLEEMTRLGVIESVEEPTEWCAGMVAVSKPGGKIRICVDLTKLNQYIRRENYPLPATEHILGQLGNACYFSKLDANSGFWQFGLAKESQKLTTFITPFGRFFFKRIPFGITSAPEIFQRKMTQLLGNIEGVVCFMDDIVVYGSSLEEHNERVRQVLKKIQEEGMTLNPEKCCQFGVKTVKFLGHTLSSEGLFIDEEKLDAITKMEAPRSTKELKSFLGMVNYLGKFIPNLADKLQPLNSLLSTKNEWVWDEPQKKSFNLLKQELVSRPNFALFDPSRTTIVSADASSFGIGGVLRQEQPDGSLKPIAYVSRTLSETEKRYSQIEKEGLAIVWTCERLKDYVTGIKIHIETDHKPLIAIFTSKSLEDMTPRLQRLKMRMMRYSYQISHIAGKKQIVADMLSRKPMSKPHKDELEEELSAYIQSIEFPATEERLLEISRKQKEDSLCSQLAKYCMSGWPKNKREVDPELRGYWQFQEDLTYQNGLLLRGQRILIPKTLRKDILEKLHQGHFGINKCRSRAKESVWWLGISQEIERMVSSCTKCLKERKPKHEPLMPSEFPIRPWQKVGMDLFYLNGRWYLIVCDYYSRYPEISLLQNLTAQEVIGRLKSIFARHGTPETVRSDNGPQFQKVLGSEFSKFSKEWSFKLITSSPKFPQSNGFIEAIIKNIKQSFKKEEDCYLTLQAYRTMPLESGYSPAELLMGRRLRTSVPAIESSLMPRYLDSEALQEREKRRVMNQKRLYDKRLDVHSLPPLQQGDSVWVRDQRVKGKVLHKSEEPRSYWVQTPQGKVRRNRLHLTPLPKMGSTMDASEDDQDDQEQETEEDCPTPTASSTRDGRMQRDNQDQDPEKSLPSMPAVHTRYGRAVKIPRSTRGTGHDNHVACFMRTRSGLFYEMANADQKPLEAPTVEAGVTTGGDAGFDPIPFNPSLNIRKYAGDEDPRQWITSLEEVGFLYRWADYIITRYAAMNLVGPAKTWYEFHKVNLATWEIFKTRLIQDFASLENKDEIMLKLNRMQGWNELAMRFAEDILLQCSKVQPNMEEMEKIQFVIGGLKKEYALALYLNPPKNIDELLEACKRIDGFEVEYLERKEKNKILMNRISQKETNHAGWNRQPREFQSYKTENYSRPMIGAPRQNQTYFPPQETRTFPRSTQRDTYRRTPGNTYDRKPRNDRVNQGMSKIGAITEMDSKSRISVNVDRIGILEALVDTGADLSIVDLRTALETGVRIETYNGNCIGPDGKRLNILGSISMDIKIDEKSLNHRFVVLESNMRSLIIGRDLLRRLNAKINCKRDILEYDIVTECQDSNEAPRKIINQQDEVVPQLCVKLVRVTVRANDGEYVVEPNEKLTLTNGLRIARCLITVRNKLADLWITNPYPRTLKIMKNQTLGYASPPTTVNYIEDDEEDKVTEIQINEDLTLSQKNELRRVLSKYSDLFSSKLGKTNLAKHRIDTENAKPIKHKPYRVSPKERDIIKEQIQDMLQEGVIRASSSPWAFPVILVRKRDGNWRYCVDYRKLNSITVKDVYPIPRIDDVMDTLQGSRYFTPIDLRSGYWQVEIEEQDKKKTAFTTSHGLYEFNVMPFGLCNAPATFERIMDNVLKNIKWKFCLCYLDDVVIYSPDFATHLGRIEAVLKCFRESNLRLNGKKCRFGFEEIEILGHVTSKDGIKPADHNVKAIRDFPRPSKTKEIQSFIGLCSYYRKFIKNFSRIADPLFKLTRKDSPFIWSESQEEAFITLKSLLTNPPILSHFDPEAPTQIHTDASNIGLGATLVQTINGQEKVISYISRSLSKPERNYSTTEKECLALVWSMSKLRPYLYGRRFKVMTDHHALCWLRNLRDPTGRLARWALKIQEYDFEIIYKSGKKHLDADGLSRGPLPEADFDDNYDSLFFNPVIEDSDEYIENIKRCLGDTEGKRSIVENFKEENGCLYKRNPRPEGRAWLLVVPRVRRKDILKEYHNHMICGHLGVTRTMHRLKDKYFWPSMLKDVVEYVRTCHLCQSRKGSNQLPAGLLHPIPAANYPFERVGIDFLGPLPSTKNRKKWMIVLTDYYTKYAETKAVIDATAREVAKFLTENVILKHGAPRYLISDRGSQFTSNLVKEITKICQIQHCLTTSYHPQTNGLTERLNRTLINMI
ncbi:K02A2.6-like, partial [Cordylochernes scorpioides]